MLQWIVGDRQQLFYSHLIHLIGTPESAQIKINITNPDLSLTSFHMSHKFITIPFSTSLYSITTKLSLLNHINNLQMSLCCKINCFGHQTQHKEINLYTYRLNIIIYSKHSEQQFSFNNLQKTKPGVNVMDST